MQRRHGRRRRRHGRASACCRLTRSSSHPPASPLFRSIAGAHIGVESHTRIRRELLLVALPLSDPVPCLGSWAASGAAAAIHFCPHPGCDAPDARSNAFPQLASCLLWWVLPVPAPCFSSARTCKCSGSIWSMQITNLERCRAILGRHGRNL